MERILKFIRQKTIEGGFSGAVVGLSGGVDSSVCAALCVRALGKENVVGIAMPAPDSDSEDEIDASKVASWLELQSFLVHPIRGLLDEFRCYEFAAQFDWEKDIRPWLQGDFSQRSHQKAHLYIMKLRSRALILASHSRKLGYFQCQTLNKTELALGWYDLFGDGAGDIAPIQHLWKFEVFQLARRLGVPDFVLERAPGSGNYPLTDEEELGFGLVEADRILTQLGSIPESERVKKICGLMKAAEFKRGAPWSLSR